MKKVIYREPGTGAIEYAKTELERLGGDPKIITEIMTMLPNEKRVKRCNYCGYPWRDGSLRNTKRTCSDECKTGIKTLQKRTQRADKALLQPNPQKRTKLEQNYIWWLEYPFWIDEYEMLKQSWKYEVPNDTDFLSFIEANNQIYGIGNRRVENKEAV